MNDRPQFDPTPYMIVITRRERQKDGSFKQKDNPYLPVAGRMVWFQFENEHSNRRLTCTTYLIEHKPITKYNSKQNAYVEVNNAIFKASISEIIDRDGGFTETIELATGYGSESENDWGDYLEKAETKAIGRALALAGFGTQYALADFEMLTADGSEALVDSPANQPVPPQINDAPPREIRNRQQRPAPQQQAPARQQDNAPAPATVNQLKYIKGLLSENSWTMDRFMDDVLTPEYKVTSYEALTKDQASQVIKGFVESGIYAGGPATSEDEFYDLSNPYAPD